MKLPSSKEHAWYITRAMLLGQTFTTFQTPGQPGEGVVWIVVVNNSRTVEEGPGVIKAEDDLVEDRESESLDRLPCLSLLSNVHDDFSPW